MTGAKGYEYIRGQLSPFGLPASNTIRNNRKTQEWDTKSAAKRARAYLESIGYSGPLGASFDATGVVVAKDFCTRTGACIGISVSMDEAATFCPYRVKATTEGLIKDALDDSKYPPAKQVLVVTLNPLAGPSLNPIPVCVVPTNNKYTANELARGIKGVLKLCKEEDLKITHVSADGDLRNLQTLWTMVVCDGLKGSSAPLQVDRYADSIVELALAQARADYLVHEDSLHLVNKLRNMLLSFARSPRLGDVEASMAHLELAHEGLVKVSATCRGESGLLTDARASLVPRTNM